MVTVEVPDFGEPMTVTLDGSKDLNVVPAGKKQSSKDSFMQSSKQSSKQSESMRPIPTPSDENRFPRAALAIDAVSILTSTTLSSLLLLPISRAKVLRQLPRSPPARAWTAPLFSQLAGARPTVTETTLRFGATTLLPPPLSLLIGYLAAVPLQGAVVRAQAGLEGVGRACASAGARLAAVAPRKLPPLTTLPGLRRTWVAHALRDIPFALFEAYALAGLLGAVVAKMKKDEAAEEQARGGTPAPPRAPPSGPRPADSILASTFAGVCTAPLDLLRTRLLVAARPSMRRTVSAGARLVRQRGPKALLTPGGASLYVAECMLRPVAFLGVYAVCRAALVSMLLTYRAQAKGREQPRQTLDSPPDGIKISKS
jgi:hypothetical protein